MKRLLFITTALALLLLSSLAFAWQDPCSVTDNAYICEGFTLDNWIETGPHFSPAPPCQGTVTLSTLNTNYFLRYVGNNGILILSHPTLLYDVVCGVSNKGNLVCKVITQPEESTMLIFGQQE